MAASTTHNFRQGWCRANSLPNSVKAFHEKKIKKRRKWLTANGLIPFCFLANDIITKPRSACQKAKPKQTCEIYLLSDMHMHFILLPSMQSIAPELIVSWPETSRERSLGWKTGCGDRGVGAGDEGCRATLLTAWAICFSRWLCCHCLTHAWGTAGLICFYPCSDLECHMKDSGICEKGEIIQLSSYGDLPVQVCTVIC